MHLVMRNPGDAGRQLAVNALLDTGADITCLPTAFIRAIGGEPASTYAVYGIAGKYVGSANSYFLEFEISTTKMLIEVLAFGDEIVLGRNLPNELALELDGPARKVRVTVTTTPQQK